jgi:hypothetical protein
LAFVAAAFSGAGPTQPDAVSSRLSSVSADVELILIGDDLLPAGGECHDMDFMAVMPCSN